MRGHYLDRAHWFGEPRDCHSDVLVVNQRQGVNPGSGMGFLLEESYFTARWVVTSAEHLLD